MNDREKFLKQIADEPADDVRRLVYADWLEEYGDRGDLDIATAEFIRLSCTRSGQRQMPAAAYNWLLGVADRAQIIGHCIQLENWKRLVPGLLAWHAERYHNDREPLGAERNGRRIHFKMRVLVSVKSGIVSRLTPMSLWFRRGFLEGCKIHHTGARELLVPVIQAEQPFCVSLVTAHMVTHEHRTTLGQW